MRQVGFLITFLILMVVNVSAEVFPKGVVLKEFYDTQKITFSNSFWFGEIPGKPGNFLVSDRFGLMSQFNPAKGLKQDFGTIATDGQFESGLMGIAFHPDFVHNRRYFIYHAGKGLPYRVVLSELKADTSLLKDSGTPPKIIWQTTDIRSQMGGKLDHVGSSPAFGPGGYLYLGIGDNNTNGLYTQSRKVYLGTVIRIDVDNPDPGKNYGIPKDNPFVNDPDTVKKEIYTYGFRNPWKLSYDKLTDDLWVTNIGGWLMDYSHPIQKGENMGWPITEGTFCFDARGTKMDHYPPLASCNKTGLTEPMVQFPHPDPMCGDCNGMVGGFVYRGNQLSKFYGAYMSMDYVEKTIWASKFVNGIPVHENVGKASVQITHMTQDSQGNVYAIVWATGKIFKFDHPDFNMGPSTVSLLPKSTKASGKLQVFSRELPTLGENQEVYDLHGKKVSVSPNRAGAKPLVPGLYFVKAK